MNTSLLDEEDQVAADQEVCPRHDCASFDNGSFTFNKTSPGQSGRCSSLPAHHAPGAALDSDHADPLPRAGSLPDIRDSKMAESFSQTRDRFWTMGWTFGAPNDLPIEELGLANHLQHTTGELFSSGAAASMAFTDTQSFKSFDGSRAGSVVTANSRAALLSAQSSSGGSKQQIAKNNRKAALLILASALTASLMSLDVKKVNKWNGGQGFVIAIATAVMGVFVSGLLMAWNKVPLVTKPDNIGWLGVRAFLGGCSCIAAFVAVGKLDLAVANTLMFTMPLWTALFAYLIIGKAWDRFDLMMATACLCGVILVSELWTIFLDSNVEESEVDELIGIGAAFGFAMANALAAVIVNTRLRDESPLSMTFLSMCVALVGSFLVLLFTGHYEYLFQAHPWYQWVCLGLIGVLMVAQQGFRNYGFALSRDSSVVTVLYSEIVFSFVWDISIMGTRPGVVEYIGALMIIIGSVSASAMKSRAAAKALEELNKAKSNEEGLPSASTLPRSIYDLLEDENDKFDKDFEGGLLRESVNSDASPP